MAKKSIRPSRRAINEMRKVRLKTGAAKYAEGSCLAMFGNTHVLCAASVEERVPPLDARHRNRLGDSGIRHAAALHP